MTSPGSLTFDITIHTLTYGGEALGRLPDGKAIFVPFALPGERVRVRVVEEKRGHARADLLEVLEASPDRIRPLCMHYSVCGGCHYQHMQYEAQLVAKAAILKDQFERIGKLTAPNIRATVPAAHFYYYRNYVQFHLTAEGKLAYFKFRPEEPFAVQECHLPEPAINMVWPQMEFESETAVERIGLRQGAGEEVQLILEGTELQPPEFRVEDLPLSAVHLSPAGALVLAGSEHVTMEVSGRLFRVSAGSFFQVNIPMAEAMVDHLLAHLSLSPDSTVMDLYCGAGLFSAFLAPRVGRLVGVEASPSAALDFELNLAEYDHVELYEAAVEEVLPYLKLRPDVIVADPPRAGIDRRSLEAILALQPAELAYVSCDPATLARDGRRLSEGGYELRHVTPFDLFPQTYHIESISFWVPRAKSIGL